VTALADRCLEALVRRTRTYERLETDVILVRDHRALADASAHLALDGQVWRVARVTGEVTLRAALPEAGGVVLLVPPGFVPAADVRGRAWLGRPLELRADDIVSGITQRACEPIGDEALAQVIQTQPERLNAHADRFSAVGAVTTAEVRAVLVSAELGADARLDREPDWQLLARWIREGVPASQVPDLLARALVEAHPRTGRFLAWAVTAGGLPLLIAAGALDERLSARLSAEGFTGVHSTLERQDLQALVERAVREAWRTAPDAVRAALQVGERVLHAAGRVDADALSMPLLRGALDRAIHDAALACGAGTPPPDAALEGLFAHLFAPTQRDVIEHMRQLARLSRLCAAPPSPPEPSPGDPAGLRAWAAFAWEHVAHGDLALRRVRRTLESVPPVVQTATRDIIERVIALRDAWNQRFARFLAAEWPRIAGNKDVGDVLALHQVTRCLVAPLLDHGHRVLLIVLDGCDLATFVELCEGVGAPVLTRPALPPSALSDALNPEVRRPVAVAPLPTVTSHARRALFAGDVPGDAALDDTESAAANSSGDQRAFAQNAALGSVSRRLFLKGELGDGTPLLNALATGTERLVAVVFNAVDDALSSKETTALPRFDFGGLGVRAGEVLAAARAAGFTVLVTADHGHTPCLGGFGGQRKASPGSVGARFGAAVEGDSVAFDRGPLPVRPLHLLTRMGTWHGTQHRGFHGGAALEEVFVPLAFLALEGDDAGPGSVATGRPRAPAWYWQSPAPEPTPSARVAGGLPGPVREVLAARVPEAVPMLERLQQLGYASGVELAASLRGRTAFHVNGALSKALAELQRALVPCPFTLENVDGRIQYRWESSKP
jgi:hypothetical protein